MQELNKKYSSPHSGCSSRGIPSESGSDNVTCSLPSKSLQSSLPGYQPRISPLLSQDSNSRVDLKMIRFNVSTPGSRKKPEVEKTDDQRCLSTPRYSTCLNTSMFSRCIPRRKATLSSQHVNLNKYPSLDQNSHGCLTSNVSSGQPLVEVQSLPYPSQHWEPGCPDIFRSFRDRMSPDWDPDEEYQALLDFTYPLRPGHLTSKEYLDDDDDDLSSDSYLKDSGIMDDSPLPSLSSTLITSNTFSLPPHHSGSSNSTNPAWEHSSHREEINLDLPHHSSSHVHLDSQPSHWTSRPSYKASVIPRVCAEGPTISEAQLSEDSVDCAIKSDCTLANSMIDSSFLSRNSNEESSNWLISAKDPAGFILTTQILPLHKEWEIDEDFLTLPYKLNELEVLAQQLDKLSVHLDNNSLSDVNGGSVKTGEDTDVHGGCLNDSLIDQSYSTEVTQLSSQLESTPGNRGQDRQCEDIIIDLKKTNDFVEKLGRWPASQLISSEPVEQGTEEQKNDSLLAHIQSFSCNLEEMVRWLYQVAETTDKWIPPQPQMDNIKASLEKCMAFKNDIKEHRGLTEAVLTSGEHLLKSLTHITPVLKETLELIARQSKKLNGHAAYLYLSVLTAMNMVKDDLESKHQEFEIASLENHSALTQDGSTLRKRQYSNPHEAGSSLQC